MFLPFEFWQNLQKDRAESLWHEKKGPRDSFDIVVIQWPQSHMASLDSLLKKKDVITGFFYATDFGDRLT